MTARHAEIQIEYLPGKTGQAGAPTEGEDAARYLRSFVESASYTDHAHGRADVAELVLSDRDGRFTGRDVAVPHLAGGEGVPQWPILRGDRFRLGLRLTGWYELGTPPVLLPWGTFEVDEVEADGGTSGTTVRVRLQSAALAGSASGFRGTARSATWPAGSDLFAVASDVAGRHGLGLEFVAPATPFERPVAQQDEPDAAFLARLCRREGLLMRVRETASDGGVRIVVADEGGLSGQDAYVVFPGDLARWRFSEAVHGRFKAATCSYFDPRKGEVVEATAKAPGWDDSAETLRVRATVGSEAEALRIARAALRDENRGGLSGRLTMAPGSPGVAAGSVVEARGFGRYDGRYLADVVTHRWSAGGGFTSDLDAVRLP